MTQTKNYKKHVVLLGWLLLTAFVLLPVTKALADKSDLEPLGVLNRTPTVNLMLGKAEMVDVGGDVSDILVADPSVVDIMAVRSDRLYLVGTKLGETNIMALDDQGNVLKRYNVHVQMDVEKLESMIQELYPNEEVQIRALTDQVVLTGNVSTPGVANKIANLVAQYAAEIQGGNAGSVDEVITNMLNVRGEQQVMLRVKIVEAARSALKDLGIETSYQDNGGELTGALTAASALGLSGGTSMGVLALSYLTDNFGPLDTVIRALEEEGIVNTLAEPNLTSISGEQAGFLAGGEFPIPTQLDRDGNLVYEFRPFGVSLNFRPVVISHNRINLELSTEVSTTSFADGLQLNGINIPTFNVRRAQTTVELPSGGTLMIAGLLKSETISGLTQLPGVGDVPVIGDLLKSDTFTRDESEVVVMITPFLVEPFAQNQADLAPVNKPILPINEGDLDNYIPSTPLPPPPAPARTGNALGQAFENSIRRVYGDKTPEGLMSDTASFGYIMD